MLCHNDLEALWFLGVAFPMFLPVIYRTPPTILIDTGSAVTILHKKLWNLVRNDDNLQKQSGPVVVANGKPLKIIGRAPIGIGVAGAKFLTRHWLPRTSPRTVFWEPTS